VSADHYFTKKPASKDQLRPLKVTLAGRDLTLTTASGVFSADRIDLGTRVLLRAAEKLPKRGNLLDLGCGWGPLALTMALERPKTTVWAVDINERAVDLVRRNSALAGVTNIRAMAPQDVPDSLTFDAIWSNPPIRIGKQTLHELLDTWLARLNPEGTATLVVQRNLGADSLQAWLAAQNPNFTVERAASAKGYRVLRIARLA